jgi:hypothetical protein
MEGNNNQANSALHRQLATLKLASRLLSHEMHSQGGSKSITLSRDEVQEIMITLDLYIEEASRRAGHQSGSGASFISAVDTQLVPARN